MGLPEGRKIVGLIIALAWVWVTPVFQIVNIVMSRDAGVWLMNLLSTRELTLAGGYTKMARLPSWAGDTRRNRLRWAR
ncbi:hypothetical protein C2855_16880 [Aeromonas bestiarum]|nr:hypothetical protein JM66_11375 [Aeromonas bestiarum]POG21997.1 hypothetical protein C2855_16880 [Aeromonas bestiarum]